MHLTAPRSWCLLVQRRRSVITLLLLCAMVAFWGLPLAGAGQQEQPPPGLSVTAVSQIASMMSEKVARTPAQRKIDSQIIYAAKMARGEPIAPGVTTLSVDLPRTADNRLRLDVRADVTDDLLDQLRALGAEVVYSHPQYRSIGVNIALDQVEAIAALDAVIHVQPQPGAITWGGTDINGNPIPWSVRREAIKARKRVERAGLLGDLQQALQNLGAITNAGSATSEGDVTHRADYARTTYSVNGSGVKVGVLSDGVTNLATSQALGDLPSVTVLPGQAGSGDEGTAMLEIIHDLAPGAQLYFAAALGGISTFAQNIRDLRTAGCHIIVDDVSYFVETPFQDGQAASVTSTTNGGVVIQAAKDVAAAGALFFSSAANSGNFDSGTSGTWEGDFVDGGAVAPPVSGYTTGRVHSFGGTTYTSLITNNTSPVNLFWSDPLGGSSNDYDLYVLDSTGSAVVAASQNYQTGTEDPYEAVSGSSLAVGDRVVIVKYSGSGRFMHLSTWRRRISNPTTGETHGHSATTAANTFGVAATPARGPYPSPHSATDVVETFSSDGPRRIFFQEDGSAITAGNFSSTGGQLLNKPDITAADGVDVTGVGGFSDPFYGTSASAPHAGAIAALVKSRNPSATAAQISTALTSSAIDIHSAGWDRNSGVGIIMAHTAVAAITPVSPPTWTDSTLTAGSTPVKVVHITELRDAINNRRAAFGLAPATWTDSTLTAGTTVVQAVHITEMRTALGQVYTAAGVGQPSYTDPTLTAGTTPVKAAHITELRAAVSALY